ncbi:histidine phosphatase family protein [Bacillus ectoiniformans]|uniref:histidine phosphatase family protein n=1 Tax=Bacillus ectoiniformans TaxID=1494429 RepID=UPI001959C944|nr:histidine phosphatase family protein [Bacillus ectoiniformans]
MIEKEIRLYRHGETQWNAAGRLQGWMDSPLTEQGIAQLEPIMDREYVVVSSDLGRAVESAERIFPQNKILQDERLREIYLGDWQGGEISNLLHNPDYLQYITKPQYFCPTTQETFEQVTTRMLSAIDTYKAHPSQKIAFVSHGVAIACLVNRLKNKPLSLIWEEFIQGGDCVLLQLEDEQWKIGTNLNNNIALG